MKGLFAFILLGALFAIAASNLDSEFEAFKIKFNRHYKSPQEEVSRKAIFAKTLKEVTERNARYERGEAKYKTGINVFSDRTENEIRNLLGYNPKRD